MGKSKSKAKQQTPEAAAQQKPAESKQQQKPAESKPQQQPKQQPAKKATKPAAEPLEIASVPGFFGHELKPNQKLLWANEVEEFCLQLNAAALGASVSAGRSTLFVLAKDAKTALCTLTPEHCEQFALPHTFTPLDGEIAFVVEGVNAIHLSGFIEVQDDEDDEDGDHFDAQYDGQYAEGDSEDESMDGDEEMMVFGDQSGSDDEEEEEDDEEEDDGRFEVIEERVHGDAAPAKAKKEEKKPAAAAPTPKAMPKEPKKAATPAKKKESDAPVAAKKELSAKTEKKIAEKVAEVTTVNNNNKKRAAPSESVEVPKKAKSNAREYKGVTIEEHAVGKGQPVVKGRKVSILYKGRLENGKQFDANQNRKKPFSFRHGIGDVIKGMDLGIEGMRAGGKRTILIPSKLGYGKAGAGPSIPGNANLIFDIEML